MNITLQRGNGKIAKAPCGHDGEVIAGTFARCLYGCKDDSKPVHFCPKCGTTDIEPFKVLANAWAGTYVDGWHCIPNGHVWEDV